MPRAFGRRPAPPVRHNLGAAGPAYLFNEGVYTPTAPIVLTAAQVEPSFATSGFDTYFVTSALADPFNNHILFYFDWNPEILWWDGAAFQWEVTTQDGSFVGGTLPDYNANDYHAVYMNFVAGTLFIQNSLGSGTLNFTGDWSQGYANADLNVGDWAGASFDYGEIGNPLPWP